MNHNGFLKETINPKLSKIRPHRLRLLQAHGGDVDDPDALELRSLVREMADKLPPKAKLKASEAAKMGQVEFVYADYMRLSLDAVHCSITALGRHVGQQDGGLLLSVEAEVAPEFVADTMRLACSALLGLTLGVNEMLGLTAASDALDAAAKEYEAKTWPDEPSA